MFSIEWDSHYHSDGRKRRRLNASTVHGWLAKMRGTLLGNERLRSQGIREMKEARAVRRYKKQKKAEQRALEQGRRRKTGSGSGFSLFGEKKSNSKAVASPHSHRPRQGSNQQVMRHVSRGNGGQKLVSRPSARGTRHHSQRSTTSSRTKGGSKRR